jgi:APA family basic amino acid/polyamine antiporter
MSSTRSPEKSLRTLKRRLGLFDSTMMMMGIVIGSGIFLTTGIMAKSVPSIPLLLASWLLGGGLVLAGALTYAELGAALPEAGGQYVYLREAYGALPAFLFGWKMFVVSMTGSIAALGMAFAEYFGRFFPALATDRYLVSFSIAFFGRNVQYSISAGQCVAVSVIVLFSFLNAIGVSWGKSIQNTLTSFKIGVLIVFVLGALAFCQKIPIDFAFNPQAIPFGQLMTGFGLAFIAVFWAFDGWNNINYIAGEIKNPRKNLTFALVFGTIGVTALYGLTNLVYFAALPLSEIAGVVPVAEKAASSLFGSGVAGLFSGIILVSVLGALNGAIFVGPRVYYAMARDGFFFSSAAKIDRRFQTPSASIFLQTVWACLLALTGTFEQLFTFAMFAGIVFWVAAAAAVFPLRKRADLSKPYKAWGYPFTPIVFIVVLVGILMNTLILKPVESLAGLFLVLTGVPVYFFWRNRR